MKSLFSKYKYDNVIIRFENEVINSHYLDESLHERLLLTLNNVIYDGVVSDGWIEKDEFYFTRIWRIYVRESSNSPYYDEYRFEQKLGAD